MTSQIESNEVIDRLVDADPTLSQFLNDDFQSEEYAMKIVTSEVVSDVLDSLNKERFLIGQVFNCTLTNEKSLKVYSNAQL